MRPITIEASVMNGYIVRVGCQTLVFNDRRQMLAEVDAYLTDPEGVTARYIERFGMQPGGEVAGAAAVPEPLRARDIERYRRVAERANAAQTRVATEAYMGGVPVGNASSVSDPNWSHTGSIATGRG